MHGGKRNGAGRPVKHLVDMAQLSAYLTSELIGRVKDAARAEGLTISEFTRGALERRLDKRKAKK